MSKKPKLSKAQTDAIKAGILNHYDQGLTADHAAVKSEDDMSKASDSEPKVGYKNPPKNTRFKPGQSGNPKGRPRSTGSGSGRQRQTNRPLDLLPSDAMFLEEGRRLIKLTENGKSCDLPIEQVAMRSTYTSAAKGDPRAQKLVLDRKASIEAIVRELRADMNAKWTAYKERAYQMLQRIEAGESDLPAPLPHPDDIILSDDHDPRIIGPTNKAEQTALETLLAKRAHLMREHAYVERFAPDNVTEDQRLQVTAESMGLDPRYYDASGLTGPFLAITQLEKNLIPPRTRWSRAEMFTAYHRALCTSRRHLEKFLTVGRKMHRIPLKRGEFYPSVAFEIDLTQFALAVSSRSDQRCEDGCDLTEEPEGRKPPRSHHLTSKPSEPKVKLVPQSAKATSKQKRTKKVVLISMLSRKSGATLSGLRKSGVAIERRSNRKGKTVYAISPAGQP